MTEFGGFEKFPEAQIAIRRACPGKNGWKGAPVLESCRTKAPQNPSSRSSLINANAFDYPFKITGIARFAAARPVDRGVRNGIATSRLLAFRRDDVSLDLAVDVSALETLGDGVLGEVGRFAEPRLVPRLDFIAQRCSLAVRERGGSPGKSDSRATLTVWAKSFSSMRSHTLNSNTPPGLRTRRDSANALNLSGKNITPNWQTTASNSRCRRAVAGRPPDAT